MRTKLKLEDPAQYLTQGMMYLLREKNNICRLELTLPDAVEPEELRAALEEVLARSPYFRTALVWEKGEPQLLDNEAPPLVVTDGRPRAVPEETNGYLFYFSCQGTTFCCDYFHFLTDGRGIMRFLTQVLLEYCNRRYGAGLAGRALVGAPMYSMEEFTHLYEKYRVQADLKRERPPVPKGGPQQWVLRTAKADWVAAAQRYGVKPFSCMMAALCRATRLCLEQDVIRYSYAVDARRAMDVPEALYNCVTIAQETVELTPDTPLATYIQAIDAGVRANMEDEKLRALLVQATGWAWEISQMKVSPRIKRRVFQMGEYAMGFQPEVWLSYLGDPLVSGPKELHDYIRDYIVWVPPDEGLLGIEAVSLNGTVTFCVQDKLVREDFDEIVGKVLGEEGVRIIKDL